MSRSPLAYPLNRAADTDVGGAADLQTDVMRFMAILALCLVAIFALVQSIPLTPAPAAPTPVPPAPEPTVAEPTVAGTPAAVTAKPQPEAATLPAPLPAGNAQPPAERVVLTRPQWVSTYQPKARAATARPAAPAPPVEPVAEPPPAPEEPGFVLRFASDAALMRAVAAHQVGVYAIESGRARRMAVTDSRISFWDASTPNAFHEMESNTVPAAVIAALTQAGVATGSVSWGVTLPGAMTAQLDTLMQEHRGGSLIIDSSGQVHWEATP